VKSASYGHHLCAAEVVEKLYQDATHLHCVSSRSFQDAGHDGAQPRQRVVLATHLHQETEDGVQMELEGLVSMVVVA
jgi:hypothetical protein